jgi:predicted transcriptional regulator
MKLFSILKNRNSINILKILLDNEKNNKISTPKAEIKDRIRFSKRPIKNLIKADLINTDGYSLSINAKGKEFLEAFTNLRNTYHRKPSPKKAFQVIYNLTTSEKRILLLTKQISEELNTETIPMQYIMQEFPINKENIIKQINNLTDLRLLERFKKEDQTLLKITETGKKTVIEQHLEEGF